MRMHVIANDEIVITKTTIQYQLHTQVKNSSIQWAPGMINKLFSHSTSEEKHSAKVRIHPMRK